MRRFCLAWIAFSALAFGGCQHRADVPSPYCHFSADEALLSDYDLSQSANEVSYHLRVIHQVVQTPGYEDIDSLIVGSLASGDDPWVMAVYAVPGEADYRIVFVEFLLETCQANFISAKTGAGPQYVVDRGTASLIACVVPRDLSDPLQTALSGQETSTWVVAHPPFRLLLWGRGDAQRCSAVVRTTSGLSWWVDLLELRFLAAS